MLVKQKFFYFLIIKLSTYYTLKILNRKYGMKSFQNCSKNLYEQIVSRNRISFH